MEDSIDRWAGINLNRLGLLRREGGNEQVAEDLAEITVKVERECANSPNSNPLLESKATQQEL